MEIVFDDYVKIIGEHIILDHISVRFVGGKVYGLKGKNGSGKTMLMRAMSGLIRPTEGSVKINGKTLGRDVSFPSSIGILLENPGFMPEYTGFQNLKILAEIQNKIQEDQIFDVLQQVGLDPYDKRKYRKYSLGMKQKLGIAAAIMEKSELILLDEPTNALDTESVEQFRNIIKELREENRIIVIASHDMQELNDCCDEIYQIENGRFKRGTSL